MLFGFVIFIFIPALLYVTTKINYLQRMRMDEVGDKVVRELAMSIDVVGTAYPSSDMEVSVLVPSALTSVDIDASTNVIRVSYKDGNVMRYPLSTAILNTHPIHLRGGARYNLDLLREDKGVFIKFEG